MKVKYCFQCGAELKGKGDVCTVCGTKIAENAENVAEANRTKSGKKQTQAKKDTGQHTMLAILLTLFLGLFGCLAAVLYSLGTVVEEDNLLNFVEEVEWTDIEMETITDGKSNYPTLGESARSYVRNYARYYKSAVTEKAFNKLVEEEFFSEYIAELVLRYVDAIKDKEYKKGYLKLEDISEFIEENEEEIDDIFETGFSGYFINFLEDYSYYNEDGIEAFEDAVCLKTYQKKLGWVLSLASFILNNYPAYIFMGVSLLFVILMIVLKRSKSMGYIGSAAVLAGGLLLAVRVGLLSIVEKLEHSLHLGVEVLPLLLNSFCKLSMWIIIILFLVALICIITRVIIGKNKRAKEWEE